MVVTDTNKKITFTEYMNLSITLKRYLTDYCVSKNYEADSIRLPMQIIDELSVESEKNEDFRNRVFKVFRKIDTIELRSICKMVGFDFWGSLDVLNAICTIETAIMKMNNKL